MMITRFILAGHRVGNTGNALLPTLVIILTLAVFLQVAASYTSHNGRLVSRQQGLSDCVSAVDGGLEYVFGQWRRKVISNGQVPIGNSDLNRTTTGTRINTTLPLWGDPSTTIHPGFSTAGVTFSDYDIQTVDQNGVPTTSSAQIPVQNIPGFPGWTGKARFYRAQLRAGANRFGGQTSVGAARYFQLTYVPLFQAAIFYENNLEIHPGALMVIAGLVHSNKDIYAAGYQKLRFTGNVSYAGRFYENAQTGGWDGQGGTTMPTMTPYWSDDRQTSTSTARGTQLNKVDRIDAFGENEATVASNGMHDILEKPDSTHPDTDDAVSNARLYNQASVRIDVNSTRPANDAQRIQVSFNSDNQPSISGVASSLAAAKVIADITAAFDAPSTMYDQREQAEVRVSTIDMAKLDAALNPAAGSKVSGSVYQTNFNGVIYINDISSGGKRAVRLRNGRSFSADTTVATPNPLYIQGDFNTGGTSPNQVPSNVSNPNGNATHVATVNGVTYNEKSCAVMADAVTILSNSWSDNNDDKTLDRRTASATTVNAAILSGDVLTTNGAPSGGAHNFPRFLENWSNVDFNYFGSLVEAFASEQFTSRWRTGQVYYWPNRKWNYDTLFDTNPPKGSTRGLLYSRGRWERL